MIEAYQLDHRPHHRDGMSYQQWLEAGGKAERRGLLQDVGGDPREPLITGDARRAVVFGTDEAARNVWLILTHAADPWLFYKIINNGGDNDGNQ